jgi:hypothetical protein
MGWFKPLRLRQLPLKPFESLGGGLVGATAYRYGTLGDAARSGSESERLPKNDSRRVERATLF